MLTSLILGAAIGLVMAVTGAGGGILAVPALAFGMGLELAQAAPVGLMATGVAAATGALLGLKDGTVRYRAAMLMAAAGVITAPLGTWTASMADNTWLTIFFACVLLFVAYRSSRQAAGVAAVEPANSNVACMVNRDTGRFVWTGFCVKALACSGSVAGLLSGLIGVGGGFVMVPALKRYTDLTMQSITATSLAVVALVSLSVVSSSVLAGNVDWMIALPFSGGALLGMTSGRRVSARLSARQLQNGFSAVAMLVAVSMIAKVVVQ